MSEKPAPREVFLSYAPEDESLCLELEKHLSLLKREGLITTWHKGQIGVGTNIDKEIGEHLSTSSIIVLLLSANFVASDACYGTEMCRAVERHNAGDAYVIPVVLRPMDNWQNTPFDRLTALPGNGTPVTAWSDAHTAWASVAQGIRSVVQDGKLPSVVASPSLPPIWNIPYPRNPYFTGRDDLLKRIESQLQAGRAMALSQAQAISGLGGIGKTQIAIEFAYRHAHEYQSVFWVLSDSRESLISGYITIALLLNLPQKDKQDQTVIIEAVKHWLQTHGSWLLILDNADDLLVVREFIPPTFGGHILLTTRAQSMGRLAKGIEVDTMDQDVGTLFLLRRVGLVAEDASLDTASPSDVATAREICEELGGLPLALDQAGAYIEETACGLKDYQHLYHFKRLDLLKERGGLVEDHREPVATTWSISFANVEEKNQASADLLRILAFVHPDAIPEEMLIEGASHLGPRLQEVASDPVLLNQAIAALLAYSLIRRDGKTLSVHRLVQAVLRDTMDELTRKQWSERAIKSVDEVFPAVKFETWSQCERYLPHALVCAELIEQEGLHLPEAANLLTHIGWYLGERGRYAEVEPPLLHAMTIREQQNESDNLDTAFTANTLGWLYKKQGKYEQAEPLYERALSIREQQHGAMHPDTANSLNNLAGLYYTQGKYTEAEPLLQRALTIHEQQLGVIHPDTATSLNNLAELYREQGKYTEAEPLFQQALATYEQQLGAVHPSTAVSLNNLAELYREQGKYTEAEPLYERALAIREQQLGSTHTDTAQSLNNLAALYREQGKYTEAEPLLQRALAIREQQLGAVHPSTAVSLNNLAELYYTQGKFAEAEPLYERALSIDEKAYGPSPAVAIDLHNLAMLYYAKGKYETAEPLFKRALLIFMQTLGEMHPNTQNTLIWYISLLGEIKRYS